MNVKSTVLHSKLLYFRLVYSILISVKDSFWKKSWNIAVVLDQEVYQKYFGQKLLKKFLGGGLCWEDFGSKCGKRVNNSNRTSYAKSLYGKPSTFYHGHNQVNTNFIRYCQ